MNCEFLQGECCTEEEFATEMAKRYIKNNNNNNILPVINS